MNRLHAIAFAFAVVPLAASCIAESDETTKELACADDRSPSNGRTSRGYVAPIKSVAVGNAASLRVEYTGHNMQMVLISIPPGRHLGAQTSLERDQFFRIDEGRGEVLINGTRTPITEESAVIVPAGALHDFVNTSTAPMKVHAIYSPPRYRRDLVIDASEDIRRAAAFDGCTTE